MSDTTKDQPPQPTPAVQVADIREVRRPDTEDRGFADPGQTFTRHAATTTAAGTANNGALAPQPLGFRARCLIADNFTSQYWYVPDANSWIPPYITGYRLLLVPTDKSEATTDFTRFSARGSVTQIAPTTAEVCVLTWCEKVILSVPCPISVATRAAP